MLVDEYQDTNRTQYDLIKLLVTDGKDPQDVEDWPFVFVVGDADQSIYSFRAADFTILMGFQDDFGDQAPDESTRTMVKLEENYRSTDLEAANALIANNSERIDKVLRPTRGEGELITLSRCDDEIAEAEAVVHRFRTMEAANPELVGVIWPCSIAPMPSPVRLKNRWCVGEPLHRGGGAALLRPARNQGSAGLFAAAGEPGRHGRPLRVINVLKRASARPRFSASPMRPTNWGFRCGMW